MTRAAAAEEDDEREEEDDAAVVAEALLRSSRPRISVEAEEAAAAEARAEEGNG